MDIYSEIEKKHKKPEEWHGIERTGMDLYIEQYRNRYLLDPKYYIGVLNIYLLILFGQNGHLISKPKNLLIVDKIK